MFRSRYHGIRPPAGRSLPVLLVLATAVVLLGALACAPGSAAASPLDYQGLAFQTGTTGDGSPVLASSFASSSAERPIYRRRPRDRYRDRYRDRDDDGYRTRAFAAFGAGNYDPDDQPDNGLWVNAELGTEVGDALDLGVRVNWYHRESGDSQVILEFEDEAGNVGQRVIETSDVETNLVPLMAFARVRFPVSNEFQPYVGGGIGWEWLTVDGIDDDGFTFEDNYDGFGAQLFGGLNLSVSRNTALYGEALWNKSTVESESFDPTLGNIKDEIDMDGLAINGGHRFRF